MSIPFLPTAQKPGGDEGKSWWTDAKLRVMFFGCETGKNYSTPFAEVIESEDGVLSQRRTRSAWIGWQTFWTRQLALA